MNRILCFFISLGVLGILWPSEAQTGSPAPCADLQSYLDQGEVASENPIVALAKSECEHLTKVREAANEYAALIKALPSQGEIQEYIEVRKADLDRKISAVTSATGELAKLNLLDERSLGLSLSPFEEKFKGFRNEYTWLTKNWEHFFIVPQKEKIDQLRELLANQHLPASSRQTITEYLSSVPKPLLGKARPPSAPLESLQRLLEAYEEVLKRKQREKIAVDTRWVSDEMRKAQGSALMEIQAAHIINKLFLRYDLLVLANECKLHMLHGITIYPRYKLEMTIRTLQEIDKSLDAPLLAILRPKLSHEIEKLGQVSAELSKVSFENSDHMLISALSRVRQTITEQASRCATDRPEIRQKWDQVQASLEDVSRLYESVDFPEEARMARHLEAEHTLMNLFILKEACYSGKRMP